MTDPTDAMLDAGFDILDELEQQDPRTTSEIAWDRGPMMITQPNGAPVTCFTVSQLHRIREQARVEGARAERERVRRAVEGEIRRMVAEGTYSVAEVDIMRRAEALIEAKEAE